jgi:hypothetical protein
VHVAVVHHEEFAAALFIAVLIPLRQLDDRDAHVPDEPELTIA